ncbi:hypothetical protein LBMAG53_20240 [Planctomycetota bacterium]|nr:hypothetical protein LBMAG53_20240 [Planctomycetota bacterium]
MSRILFPFLALAAFTGASVAADDAADKAAVKPYPLDTCIVSGEKLGGMGAPIVKVVGDQEVKFCCKGCTKDFDKDPAKFLKKLETAKAGSATAGATAPKSDEKH